MLGTDRYAMAACVARGIDAVVVVGPAGRDNGYVPVPEPLRLLAVDDQASLDDIMTALYRAGLDGHRFTGIQTSDEWALIPASLLAPQLGCDFLDPGTAVGFRDKSLQKHRVRAAGLRAARVTVIDDIFDVSGLDELPYPKAVLKPIAGAATMHTSVIGSLADLRARSDAARRARIGQRTFALEEFVGGEEWVADGVVFDGELAFCSIGTYSDPCLTAVDNNLALSIRRFDPERDSGCFDRALPVVRGALRALGLPGGVFHMELFHDPETGQITFSECAARRGGGLIHEELQAKFGLSLGESAVLAAIGQPPPPPGETDPRVIGGALLNGRPGILMGCPTSDEVAGRPGVLFARVERPYGTRLAADLNSTNDRVGQVLLAADSDAEFSQRLAEVRAWFGERVVALPDGALNRELRAWQRQTWPADDFDDRLYQRRPAAV